MLSKSIVYTLKCAIFNVGIHFPFGYKLTYLFVYFSNIIYINYKHVVSKYRYAYTNMKVLRQRLTVFSSTGI